MARNLFRVGERQTRTAELDTRRRRKGQSHWGGEKGYVVTRSGILQANRLRCTASIPYPELLAYAQSLSAFTSAPPNMPDLTLPGQNPPPLFFPPFPNEEKMRRGHLNAEAPLGLLGETHSVGRRKNFLSVMSILVSSD